MARLKLSGHCKLHFARVGDTGSPTVLLHASGAETMACSSSPTQDAWGRPFNQADFVDFAETDYAPNCERTAEIAAALLSFWRALDREEINS